MVAFDDCAGLRELIVDGTNGLLLRRDPIVLVAALDRLINDAALRARLSAAAPASMAPYSLDAYRTRWLTLLDEVIR
jgi:glycosyltransferase involved in cell wall biosynthesis